MSDVHLKMFRHVSYLQFFTFLVILDVYICRNNLNCLMIKRISFLFIHLWNFIIKRVAVYCDILVLAGSSSLFLWHGLGFIPKVFFATRKKKLTPDSALCNIYISINLANTYQLVYLWWGQSLNFCNIFHIVKNSNSKQDSNIGLSLS